MSQFKAKYHALQILQRLATGERPLGKGGSSSTSPRKQGIKTSDDILKEKYTELAELMAVQRLEKQAVSALQKMYVSPPKGERRSRRRRRDGDKGRRRRSREGDGDEVKNQRPQSASSTSSYSSYSSGMSYSSSVSHGSRASSMSNASRASSMSHGSRSSSMSNSSRASSKSNSSTSSTRSKSSSTAKPVERHFVTIIEEEEEEEVINQDEIEERQIVQFDEDLAKENEEEARRKKEESKRTRRVSFVLEAEEQSSNDEEEDGNSDSTLKDDDVVFTGEEMPAPSSKAERKVDRCGYDDEGDPTPRYIEIENSLLREILSPRSPRRIMKLSSRSPEKSPARSRSMSPKRSRRSPSPKRAWEVSDSLPLPPRPQKDIIPSDHKLSNTDNPEIKKWLRHKNALIRREKKAERMKEREERQAAEAAAEKKLNRLIESEQYYDTWVKHKVTDLRKRQKVGRFAAKEDKRRAEEEKIRREEIFREKQRMSIASFGDKVPVPRNSKKGRRKPRSRNVEEDNNKLNLSNQRTGSAKGNANPFKGVTYDEWMRQKMKQEESWKKQERQKKEKRDPQLEKVIPSIAKERIERAKSGKGKRVDTGVRKERDDLPEREQPKVQTDAPKPYTWLKDETTHSAQSREDRGGPLGRVGLQRPSSARNRLPNAPRQQRRPARPSSSEKSRHPGMFSPSFARPEPQGSESNDDHSEHSGKLPIGKPNTSDGNNNESELISKALIERTTHHQGIADPDDLSIFLTEFDT